MTNKINNLKFDSNSDIIIHENCEETKLNKKIDLNNNDNDKQDLNKLEEPNSSINIIEQKEKNKNEIINEKKVYEENGFNVNFIPEIIEKEKKKLEIQYNEKELKLKNEIENGNKKEINEYIENINKLKNELNLKNENLIKISQANGTLRKKLSELSEKVNSLFNNSINQKTIIRKLNTDISNKEKISLEEQLKMKEIQLKSIQNLFDAVNKENKSLKEKLDIFNNDEVKMKLINELKSKDNEINKLNQEKKELKFQLEQHNNCLKQYEIYKKEIEDITQELIKYKNKYIKLKLEYDKINTKDLNGKNNTNNNNQNLSKVKKKIEITKISNVNLVQKHLNLSKSETDIKAKQNIKKYNFSLFSDIEKKAIFTLFNNKEDLISFNKKISIIESFKNSNENALKNTIKLLKNELNEKKELIQYLSLKLKENEKMLILSCNHYNESDIKKQILKRKIKEQDEIINLLKNDNNNIEENNEINNNIKNIDIAKRMDVKLKEINKIKKDLNINNNSYKSFRYSSNNIFNSLIPLIPKNITIRAKSKENELNDDNNKQQIRLSKDKSIQK